MTMLLHATCVAIGERAVLITGPSGAGKSDLALRLIDRGGMLVSDDQVSLTLIDGIVQAEAPPTIAGRIEVRGLGIIAMAYRSPMPVVLLIELAPTVERLPDVKRRDLGGAQLPVVTLNPFETSAAIKVELALREHGLRP